MGRRFIENKHSTDIEARLTLSVNAHTVARSIPRRRRRIRVNVDGRVRFSSPPRGGGGRGGGDSTSVECLFSITPHTDAWRRRRRFNVRICCSQ